MAKFSVVVTDRFTGKACVHDVYPSKSLANEAAYFLEQSNFDGLYSITVVAEKPSTRQSNPSTKAGKHAAYLFEHYKQSGAGLADELFNQIVRNEKLTVSQKAAVTQKFQELLKAGKRKTNPVPPSKIVQRRNAADLYQRFTGHDALDEVKIDKPVLPDVMLVVGDIDGIMYTTVRDGVVEKYVHQFKKKASPLFCVSHDGKQIYLVGGEYDFTERGIVDRT